MEGKGAAGEVVTYLAPACEQNQKLLVYRRYYICTEVTKERQGILECSTLV
jgi:hypothetical protein